MVEQLLRREAASLGQCCKSRRSFTTIGEVAPDSLRIGTRVGNIESETAFLVTRDQDNSLTTQRHSRCKTPS
jgi:hypothetical protein